MYLPADVQYTQTPAILEAIQINHRRKSLSASSSSSSNVTGDLSALRSFFFGGTVKCVRSSSGSEGRSNVGETYPSSEGGAMVGPLYFPPSPRWR